MSSTSDLPKILKLNMTQQTISTTNESEIPARKSREISGTKVVIGMLTLGVMATGLLFLYFELHTRPFRPLREALGREFKHSRPNVEGGRLKGRGPMILRISMSVPFDPFVEETKATELNSRVLEISRKYHDLETFEQVQVNLIFFVPESAAKRRTFDWKSKQKAEDLGNRPRSLSAA